MFTGIIETIGSISKVVREGSNVHFTIESALSNELKIDQSVAHNGVCLTVVACDEVSHVVTAIQETLDRTSLGSWQVGSKVNIERSLRPDSRLDGHLVQGHVDTTGTCVEVREVGGSWYYRFKYTTKPEWMLVDKGSVCINGVSLTVVEPDLEGYFSVAIIPYTYEHTNFHQLAVGSVVNLEFDIIGKYMARHLAAYLQHVKV